MATIHVFRATPQEVPAPVLPSRKDAWNGMCSTERAWALNAIETIETFARRDARYNKPNFFRKLNECVVNKRDKEKCHRLAKELEEIAFQGKFNGSSSLWFALRSKGAGCYMRWRKRFQQDIRQNVLEVVFRVHMTDACHCFLQHRLIENLRECTSTTHPVKAVHDDSPATSISGNDDSEATD